MTKFCCDLCQKEIPKIHPYMVIGDTTGEFSGDGSPVFNNAQDWDLCRDCVQRIILDCMNYIKEMAKENEK